MLVRKEYKTICLRLIQMGAMTLITVQCFDEDLFPEKGGH